MPYEIVKSNKKGFAWMVINKDTGKVRGHVKSKEAAKRFLAALYANAGGK